MQYTPGGPCREDCGVGGTLPHWYTLLTRVIYFINMRVASNL